jgi:hypothetical protein
MAAIGYAIMLAAASGVFLADLFVPWNVARWGLLGAGTLCLGVEIAVKVQKRHSWDVKGWRILYGSLCVSLAASQALRFVFLELTSLLYEGYKAKYSQ